MARLWRIIFLGFFIGLSRQKCEASVRRWLTEYSPTLRPMREEMSMARKVNLLQINSNSEFWLVNITPTQVHLKMKISYSAKNRKNKCMKEKRTVILKRKQFWKWFLPWKCYRCVSNFASSNYCSDFMGEFGPKLTKTWLWAKLSELNV